MFFFFATSFSFCIIGQNPLTWYLNFVLQMMACVEGWSLSSLVAKKRNHCHPLLVKPSLLDDYHHFLLINCEHGLFNLHHLSFDVVIPTLLDHFQLLI
jgi:hypothetical protein